RDLAVLLEAAAPEPPRLFDPEVLLRVARRRATIHRRVGGCLGAAVIAGGVATALLVPRGDHRPASASGGISTPVVSALLTTQPLPAAAVQALAHSPFTTTGRGSLVRRTGGEQIYLVPVNEGQLICIVDVV